MITNKTIDEAYKRFLADISKGISTKKACEILFRTGYDNAIQDIKERVQQQSETKQ